MSSDTSGIAFLYDRYVVFCTILVVESLYREADSTNCDLVSGVYIIVSTTAIWYCWNLSNWYQFWTGIVEFANSLLLGCTWYSLSLHRVLLKKNRGNPLIAAIRILQYAYSERHCVKTWILAHSIKTGLSLGIFYPNYWYDVSSAAYLENRHGDNPRGVGGGGEQPQGHLPTLGASGRMPSAVRRLQGVFVDLFRTPPSINILLTFFLECNTL